jgi:serine/threonine protein kinase, bacterial
MDDLGVGQDLGGYAIVEVAGEGGMGIVYKAEQRALSRTVALKVIRPEIAQSREYRWRFLREAKLAAAVDHPHVVSVFDVGDHDGRLYMAMQWIDGTDLRTLLDRQERLAADRAVAVGVQLAGALDAVAGAGLVHRDVKPSNVLIRDLGGHDHAYLTDFGVAKVPGAEDNLTRAGWQVGTSGYMSPEQVRGEQPDARSDLYALGCVLFEAMTGERPFDGDNDLAVRWAHASSARPAPSAAWPALGHSYDAFFARALAVAPDDRFPSGRTFAAEMEAAHASRPTDQNHVTITDAPTLLRPDTDPAATAIARALGQAVTAENTTPARQGMPTIVAAASPVPVGQKSPTPAAKDGPRGQDMPTAIAGPTYAPGDAAAPRKPAPTRQPGRLVALALGLAALCAVAITLTTVLHSHGHGHGSGSGGSPSAGRPIGIGRKSYAIAITSNGDTAYVADGFGDEVTPVDLSTGTLGAPITVGTGAFSIAIAPDDRTAYATSFNDNDVIPINLATGATGPGIQVGAGPFAIAITSNGHTAYVADSDDRSVTPIDLATGTPGPPIQVGGSPQSIAISPNGQTVYVGNYDDGSVTPISVATDTAGVPIPVGHGPAAIAITPNGQTAYVVNSEDDTVTPIDLATGRADSPIPVGANPFAIAITPNGGTAYVADLNGNAVTPIDLATGRAGPPIPIALRPRAIAITPDGQVAYVASSGNDTIVPIDNASG